MTAAVLSVAAYALVIRAQTRGPLAPIAALREASVIFGAIIGALIFHEHFGRRRIVATVLVTAGVVLINLCPGRLKTCHTDRSRQPADPDEHGAAT